MLPNALSAFPHGQALLFRQKRLLHVVDALSDSAVSPSDFLHLALPSPNYSISNTGFRSALPSVLSFSNNASIKKSKSLLLPDDWQKTKSCIGSIQQ